MDAYTFTWSRCPTQVGNCVRGTYRPPKPVVAVAQLQTRSFMSSTELVRLHDEQGMES